MSVKDRKITSNEYRSGPKSKETSCQEDTQEEKDTKSPSSTTTVDQNASEKTLWCHRKKTAAVWFFMIKLAWKQFFDDRLPEILYHDGKRTSLSCRSCHRCWKIRCQIPRMASNLWMRLETSNFFSQTLWSTSDIPSRNAWRRGWCHLLESTVSQHYSGPISPLPSMPKTQ